MLTLHQDLIALVWPLTAGLVILSLMIYAVMMLVQALTGDRQAHRAARRKDIERLLILSMDTSLKDLRQALLQHAGERELLAEVAPKAMRRLKGQAYARMRANLTELGMRDWAVAGFRSRRQRRKLAAIHMLAHWPDPEVRALLRQGLAHRHRLVRQACISSLAEMQDVAALPAILEQFREGALSVPAMAEAFRVFGPGIAEDLHGWLQSKKATIPMSMAILLALSSIMSPAELHPIALTFAAHKNAQLRALAYGILAESGQTLDPAWLQAAAADPDPRVRQAVARCAGHQTPLPVGLLLRLLQDADWLTALQSGLILYDQGARGRKALGVYAKRRDLSGIRARMLLDEAREDGPGLHGLA